MTGSPEPGQPVTTISELQRQKYGGRWLRKATCACQYTHVHPCLKAHALALCAPNTPTHEIANSSGSRVKVSFPFLQRSVCHRERVAVFLGAGMLLQTELHKSDGYHSSSLTLPVLASGSSNGVMEHSPLGILFLVWF